MKGVGFLLGVSLPPLDHATREIVIRIILATIITAMTVHESLLLIQSSLRFYIWLRFLCRLLVVGSLMDISEEGNGTSTRGCFAGNKLFL